MEVAGIHLNIINNNQMESRSLYPLIQSIAEKMGFGAGKSFCNEKLKAAAALEVSRKHI